MKNLVMAGSTYQLIIKRIKFLGHESVKVVSLSEASNELGPINILTYLCTNNNV